MTIDFDARAMILLSSRASAGSALIHVNCDHE
jgi:hypothetical protein